MKNRLPEEKENTRNERTVSGVFPWVWVWGLEKPLWRGAIPAGVDRREIKNAAQNTDSVFASHPCDHTTGPGRLQENSIVFYRVRMD